MGRLFTYMVKAADGQQPAPYTGYYGVWGSHGGPSWATGVYSIPLSFRGVYQDRYNAIDRLFSASKNVDDWNALAGGAETNWGTNYLTAIDKRFTSPEAIYNILSANPAYLEAIRHLANTGSEDKLGELLQGWSRDDPNFIGDGLVRLEYLPGVLGATDYDIADKVGNAQLIINNYLAYEASIKRAAEEEARRQQTVNTANAAPVTAAPVTANTPNTPVTAPTIPGAANASNAAVAPQAAAPQPQATRGTFRQPAFASSPTQQVSFYNLPAGMTQEQAMENWNRIGRSRMQRYLERTGRQGANNIQVSPDGSTIKFIHYNGGSTETDTSLPPPSNRREQATGQSNLVRRSARTNVVPSRYPSNF